MSQQPNSDLLELFQEAADFLDNNLPDTNSETCENEQNIANQCTAMSDEKQLEQISKIVDRHWGFPALPMYGLVRRKCELEMKQGLRQEAALTTLQSQALSFRHQALTQFQKRSLLKVNQTIAKAVKNESDDMFDDPSDPKGGVEDEDEVALKLLAFQTSCREGNGQLLDLIRDLPDHWRVVQITIDDESGASRFKKTKTDEAVDANFGLNIVTVECGSDPKVDIFDVPALSAVTEDQPSVLKEFHDILDLHKIMYKTDVDKKKYRSTCKELDARMQSLLDTIEDNWLGFFKCLLLGHRIDDEEKQAIDKIAREILSKVGYEFKDVTLLKKLLDGHSLLTSTQVRKAAKYFGDDNLMIKLDEIKTKLSSDPVRHPTVLVLGKEVQALPWDALRVFSNHPVSRVPSIHTLAMLQASHKRLSSTSVTSTGVRPDKIFYVLNPDQNLAKTQERLEGPFATIGSDGVVGQQPSLPQMKRVLSEMDAFMYAGHGGSLKNVPSQEIEKMSVRAVPLLFGCNSGKLERLGRQLDPIGMANNYFIATAPCLLGFLWPITDRDVDNWTVTFLQHWLGLNLKLPTSGSDKDSGVDHEPEFVRAVANQRKNFTRIINGAATVVYGLPCVQSN